MEISIDTQTDRQTHKPAAHVCQRLKIALKCKIFGTYILIMIPMWILATLHVVALHMVPSVLAPTWASSISIGIVLGMGSGAMLCVEQKK